MAPQAFERLVDQVASSELSHPCGASLPGNSLAMQELAKDLARVHEGLTHDPAKHRCGVVFLHPPAPSWLGQELLRLCGLNAEAIYELHPRSPVYNAGLLFGQIRSPGRFEAGGHGVVGVTGLGGLGENQFNRLRAHLEAWWFKRPDEACYHLVMTAEEHPGIVAAAQTAGATIIR